MKQSSSNNIIFVIIICFFFISVPILAQYYPEGMVAYWKFEEGTGTIVNDCIGNHQGIFFNGPEWTEGIVGSALLFNGLDTYIEIAHDPSFNPGEQFTLEAWGYLFGPDNVEHDTFISKHGPSIPGNEFVSPFQFWVSNWGWLALDYNYGYGWIDFYSDNDVYENNQWNHVVFTKDHGTLNLYYNGDLVRTGTESSDLPTSEAPVCIGANCGGWGSFNGVIDEVAIYARALSNEEIQEHYENGLQGLGYETAIPIAIDIKPQSCPNPLNIKSKGVLSVAILGSADLDVNNIVVSSILLEGIAPIRNEVEDVSTPVMDGDECECTSDGADGFDDLTLKFDTQEIIAAIGSVNKSDQEVLSVTGNLVDGTSIFGKDCVIIKSKGNSLSKTVSENLRVNFSLEQNHPNPFNPSTIIQYALSSRQLITLKVYDVLGNEIAILVNEEKPAGSYEVEFSSGLIHQTIGGQLPGGVYFYQLRAGNFTETKKMVIMK